MELRHGIKQHPVLSYCLFVMLWSCSWWALILTAVPIGTLFQMPMRPVALVFMILGGIGPLLAGLTLTRIVDGKGSVIALLARLKRWRVGWLWLALLIPYGLTILLYLLPVAAGVAPATASLATIGPAIGLGLYAGFFEEMGWSGFMLPKVQRRFNPLIAALLVGLFWGGIWHLYGVTTSGLLGTWAGGASSWSSCKPLSCSQLSALCSSGCTTARK